MFAELDPRGLARLLGRVLVMNLHAAQMIGAALTPAPLGRKGKSLHARALAHARHLDSVLRAHGFSIEIEGELPTSPAVIVANHLSYLDPLLVASRVPCACIAKAELAGWPVIGPAARTMGVLFVDRRSVHSGARVLRGALRALDEGLCVLNFPEGTTTRGDRLLPFKRGIFGAAMIADVPVYPVHVSYDVPEMAWVDNAFFLPHYLRTAARPRTIARLRIGRQLRPSSYTSAERFAAATHAAIARLAPPGIGLGPRMSA